MLKLKLKRNEKVFMEFQGKTIGMMITGYKEGAYHAVFAGPKEVKIIREKLKVKDTEKESIDENRI